MDGARSRLMPDLGVLLATLIWGSTFVVVRGALREISPLLFVALRFTLAFVILAPAAAVRWGRPRRAELRAGVVVGFWLFLGFAFQTVGLVGTPPARAAFLTGMAVVLVPVLSVVVYRRRPATGALVGVALAAVGLALLTGAGWETPAVGDLLLLACALAFAFQILAVGRFASTVAPGMLLIVELATVAALAWPAAFLMESPRLGSGPAGWGAVVFTAFFATLAALWLQNWGQRRTPPTRAAVIFAMEPVFAALFSFALTGERFGPREAAGAGLIIAGTVAVEVLAARRASRNGPATG